MSWAGSFTCLSFKQELFEGKHDFRSDMFYLALYNEQANLTDAVTGYMTDNELPPFDGYTTGGQLITVYAPRVVNKTSLVDFDDVVWNPASFTARGALAYNWSKPGLPALFVLDFGAPRIPNAGSFIVRFPGATAESAILRIT